MISGLARGIETEAHTATLEASGRTIAVVGTGILRTYPRENAALADRIAQNGAVVSQFWPDAPPTKYSFPMRNAVMSGISQGTAVIEASATSGAKMQARIALEQGKRAFLMASLVTREEWAQRYLGRGGCTRSATGLRGHPCEPIGAAAFRSRRRPRRQDVRARCFGLPVCKVRRCEPYVPRVDLRAHHRRRRQRSSGQGR